MALCRASRSVFVPVRQANVAVLDILRKSKGTNFMAWHLTTKQNQLILQNKQTKREFKIDKEKSEIQIQNVVGDLSTSPATYLSDRVWMHHSCFKLKRLDLQQGRIQREFLEGALSCPELDALLGNDFFFKWATKNHSKLPAFLRNIIFNYIARFSQDQEHLIYESQMFKETVFTMGKEDRENAMYAMVYQLLRSNDENRFEIAVSFLEAEKAKKKDHVESWKEILMFDPTNEALERPQQDGTFKPFDVQLAKSIHPETGDFVASDYIDLVGRQSISDALDGVRHLLNSNLESCVKQETLRLLLNSAPVMKSEIEKDPVFIKQIAPLLNVDMLLSIEGNFRKRSRESELITRVAMATNYKQFIPIDQAPDYFFHWVLNHSVQDLVNYCEMSSEKHLHGIFSGGLTKGKIDELADNVQILLPILEDQKLVLDFAVFLGNSQSAKELKNIFKDVEINRNFYDLVTSGMVSTKAESFALPDMEGVLPSTSLFFKYLKLNDTDLKEKFQDEIERRLLSEYGALDELGAYRFNNQGRNSIDKMFTINGQRDTDFLQKLVSSNATPAPVLKYLNENNYHFNNMKQSLTMDEASTLSLKSFTEMLNAFKSYPSLTNLRDLLVIYFSETFGEVRENPSEMFALGQAAVDNLSSWRTPEIAGLVVDCRPLLSAEFIVKYLKYFGDNHQDEFPVLIRTMIKPKDYKHRPQLKDQVTDIIFHYLRNYAKTAKWNEIDSSITFLSTHMKLDLRSWKTHMAEVATEWASQEPEQFLERAYKIQKDQKVKIIDGKLSNVFINDDLFKLQVTKEIRDRGLDQNAAKLQVIFNLVRDGNGIAARELIQNSPFESFEQRMLDHMLVNHAKQHPVAKNGVSLYNELLKALEPGMSSVDAQTMLTTVFNRLKSLDIPAQMMLEFAENLDEFSLLPGEQNGLKNYLLSRRYISYKADPAISKFADAINIKNVDKALDLARREMQDSPAFARSKFIIEMLSQLIIDEKSSITNLEQLLDIIDTTSPQYQLTWKHNLNVITRLLEDHKLDRVELLLRNTQLPAKDNKFHRQFIDKASTLLSSFTDQDPVKTLPSLRSLLQLVATGQHGIPPSFVPELSDRILIGSWIQHGHSITKLLYVLENEIHEQNLKSKIDLFTDYLVRNPTYNALGALQTIAKSKFEMDRRRPEHDIFLKASNAGFCLGVINYSDSPTLSSVEDVLTSMKVTSATCRLFIINYLISSLSVHALSSAPTDLGKFKTAVEALSEYVPQPAESIFVNPIFAQKFKTLISSIPTEKHHELINILRSSGIMTTSIL